MQILKKIFTIKEVPFLYWSSLKPYNIKPQLSTFLYLTQEFSKTILVNKRNIINFWNIFAVVFLIY